jgi:hypothetical protein
MIEKLDKELSNLPEGFIVGVITSSEEYKDANLEILNFLVNKQGATGSYVTINRPYTNVIGILKKQNIDPKKLHFIDCITKTLGGKIPKADNCEFINSPSHLTDLSIALHKYFTSSEDKNRFLHLDSLSTLNIHNEAGSVLKFVHYLTGKMRVFGLKGVILSLREETDKKLIAELSQFCDKMIKL